jgi:hypothetical protein
MTFKEIIKKALNNEKIKNPLRNQLQKIEDMPYHGVYLMLTIQHIQEIIDNAGIEIKSKGDCCPACGVIVGSGCLKYIQDEVVGD